MIFSPRFVNKLAGLVALIAVLAFVGGGIYKAIHLPMFNISRILLEPKQGDRLNYVSPASIQNTIARRIQGNFITLDLNKLQEVLHTSPWIRKVDITRLWPNGLLLRIEEQEPFALWNDDSMINTWGELYRANHSDLLKTVTPPQFRGPDGSEKLVVQRYAELMRLLAPLNLSVKELDLNDRYAWSVVLNNGMRMIIGRDPGAEIANPYDGKGAISFASTIERFVRIWPVLLERTRGRKIKSVDLRYTKGLAVIFEKSKEQTSVISKDSKEKR